MDGRMDVKTVYPPPPPTNIVCGVYKDTDRTANNVITAPNEQSEMDVHCLPKTVCPKTQDHYGTPPSHLIQTTVPALVSKFVYLYNLLSFLHVFLAHFPASLFMKMFLKGKYFGETSTIDI